MKLAKTAHCGYIYEDGHAVVVHQENHSKAGHVEWVEVYEKIPGHCSFKGRIVFHHMHYDRLFRMAMEAQNIRCSTASTENGSENTKKLGLRIGNLSLEFKDGGNLYWTLLPDILSNGITYQPEFTESFNPEWKSGYACWGDKRITKVHCLKREAEPLAVAA